MKWLIALSLLVGGSAVAQAQTTRFYAPNGNSTGSERWENGGSRLVFRDNSGNAHGYWAHEGSEWVHRDNSGNMLGRAKTLPQ